MGGELAVGASGTTRDELDWSLLEHPAHAGVARFVADLNRLYRDSSRCTGGTSTRRVSPGSWPTTPTNDVLAWLRRGREGNLLAVVNCTPVVREGYRIGVPRPGAWIERLNSDADEYGGSGVGNLGRVESSPLGAHGFAQSLEPGYPRSGSSCSAMSR